jgi:hypothetical protein
MTQEWPAPAVAVAGIVWTTNSDDGTVSHIDATTGRRRGGPIRVGREPKGVSEGFGSVWVAKGRDDTVTRSTRGPDAGSAGRSASAISRASRPRAPVWCGSRASAPEWSAASIRAPVAWSGPLRVGRHPVGIAFGASHVWVASLWDGTVTKIRP